jgi:cell division protein FtsB
MIKVNLLPPEYRKVERTPLLRFVAIIGGVILSASAIAAFLYVHFGMLVEAQAQLDKSKEVYETKASLAKQSQALEREAKEYKKRRDNIERIGQNRMLWSKKLDEFCDVVHNRGDRQRHLVWLGTMETLAPGRASSTGGFHIKGWSGGPEMKHMSDFHLDLKDSDFFQDFDQIDNPEGRVIQFDDDRVPDSGWEFDFNMRLKPAGKVAK